MLDWTNGRRVPWHFVQHALAGSQHLPCPSGDRAGSFTHSWIHGVIVYIDDVKRILADVLSLGDAASSLTEQSPLLGSIPELDSMAVVNLIGALEEHFGFFVDDDEISASTFETLGSLTAFVEQKMA
jgi:acyl carrier protein